MKKIILKICVCLILFSCTDDSSNSDLENKNETVNNDKILFYDNEYKLDSNIKDASYLISLREEESINNIETNNGYQYGLNTSDHIINLFNEYSESTLKKVTKKNGASILEGEFKKDGLSCLIILSVTDDTRCLILKQPLLESVSATFFRDENTVALLINNKVTNIKDLYFYEKNKGFSKKESFNIVGTILRSYHGYDESKSITGLHGDYVAFLVKSNNEKNIIFYKQTYHDVYDIVSKIELSNSDIQDVNNEPFFMYNGYLRQGYSNSVYYETSFDNRTISDSGLLIRNKDSYFQFHYQFDYVERGFNIPSIFVWVPRRENMPLHYPDYTLERIRCCKAVNVPVDAGLRNHVNELSWLTVGGYKKYILAYGELAGPEHYSYSDNTINIEKAIILINGDDVLHLKDTEERPYVMMRPIVLYDYDNPTSDEENLINVLGYDVVTKIENYVRGFKITGEKDGLERIIFFNPKTREIEEPYLEDQQTFVIKERI
jgi:hypothetical protein